MKSLDFSGASRLLLIQLVAAVLLALFTWALSPTNALHIFAGGLIATIVTAAFAALIFTGKSRDSTSAAGWMLGAEFIKLVLAAALIAAYFYWNRPAGSTQAVSFFVGFMTVYLLPGLVSLRQGAE
ncbi:MAG: ATP synthase subunit I [Arenicellales bacterium WSBS_2016_MAG_OTU3]